jgi:hypothetical protein
MLCMNTRYENNESQVGFEKLPHDVRAGVEFLRRQTGITKVLLFAHSGGGPLLSFYQAVAEAGPSYCRGPNKLVECGNDLAGLPPADGIVFADAHPGNAINLLRSINPAVADENNPPDAPPSPRSTCSTRGTASIPRGLRFIRQNSRRATSRLKPSA